jgi:F-type H+-transporting ATPase subunit a
MCYEFSASMLKDSAGNEGMRFFPFIFALFMFLLVGNLIGMFPYFPTIASQIVITVALALVVFFMVMIAGFIRHGLHFFKRFVPSGIPIAILPLVVAIEIISFFTRPVSHSVRLFANMLAGHITIKVFAGFVFSLGTLGAVGIVGAILPLIMVIGLSALEILIAALQAYVFAMLACIYINDAIHPGH